MPVVSVKEISDRGGSTDDKSARRYRRTFQVIVSSTNDGAQLVRQATGIPRIGDPYVTPTEQDTGATAIKIDADNDQDDPLSWKVAVEYASHQRDPEKNKEDPLDRPAEIDWGFEQFKKAIQKDLDGKDLLNSAGEPFDPPVEIDDSRPTLKITRNEQVYNQFLAIEYQDAMNTDQFFGFAAGQAKIKSISAKRQYENNVYFWKVTYEIHFRREGWDLELLDAGYNEIKERGSKGLGTYERYLDPIRSKKDGTPLSGPVPLDGNGKKLKPGAARVYLPFHVLKKKPFAPLNLP